jgi:phosphoribosylformylglycinamidine synthase
MKQIALRFIKPDGSKADGVFPFNPNGAMDDIAGITDPTGRVLALMPHPERGMFHWQRDDYALLKDKARRDGKTLPEQADGLQIFENAAQYFGIKAALKRA